MSGRSFLAHVPGLGQKPFSGHTDNLNWQPPGTGMQAKCLIPGSQGF